ncbi:MAG: ferric iron uptake transcriptional regulator [Gammaproteobacteria bacterium]|nr:ferric iron uptake transcriptional regulator [Gammaproteobacteria bacterium]
MQSEDLRKAGLKATLPRLRILTILEENTERHMSAEDVYRSLLDAGDEIGLATVYRVLSQFQAAGLVEKHHFEDGHAVFEMGSGEHHDHLVCVKCGKIVEFVDDIIEERQQTVADKYGFEITDHSMVVYGICKPTCES